MDLLQPIKFKSLQRVLVVLFSAQRDILENTLPARKQ